MLILCRRFYEERHRWPPLTFNGGEAAHVRNAYKREVWSETRAAPWTSNDFVGVSFQKTFEFDMYVDPSDLLSDKSIIPSRRHWTYEFDSQAHRSLYRYFPTKPPFASKSVIISYLSQEEVCVQDIIARVNNGLVHMIGE